MILDFSLTEDDIFKFNFYSGWGSPEKKSYRIWYYIKFIAYAFFGVLFLIVISRKEPINFPMLAGLAIIVGLSFSYFNIENTYKNHIRKLISPQHNSAFYVMRQMIINETGITDKDENSETKYAWSAIIKKVENEEYFYLYLSSLHSIIIPQRVLDQKQREELRLLLSRHLTLTAEIDHMYSN